MTAAAVDTYSEDWRAECEARFVCRLPTRSRRLAYLEGVAQRRGKPAADELGDSVQREWSRLKNPAPLIDGSATSAAQHGVASIDTPDDGSSLACCVGGNSNRVLPLGDGLST